MKKVWMIATGAVIVTVVIIGIVIVIVGGLFFAKGGMTKILPPMPVIVSDEASMTSNLLDMTYRVSATVRNDGGNGDVVLEATLNEDDKSWTKTVRRTFTTNETFKMSIEFPEATISGDKRTYRVSVR